MRSFNVGNIELVTIELLSLAIPLLLIVLLYFLARRAVSSSVRDAMGARGSGGEEAGLSAREVLDRRYADGELTGEEYLTIKDDITRDENA